MIAVEAPVAQILVRNLDDRLKVRLRHRARKNGRSMEEEAREILRNALRQKDTPRLALEPRRQPSSAIAVSKKAKKFTSGAASRLNRSRLTNDHPRQQRDFGAHAAQS